MTAGKPRGGEAEPDDLGRVRVSFIQRATLVHAGGTEQALLLDLGLRGVFVERASPLPPDSFVELAFRLPGNELPVAARCRVAWWHPEEVPLGRGQRPAGHGLEFVALTDADRERIRRHLGGHQRRPVRARQYARPWPDEESGQD